MKSKLRVTLLALSLLLTIGATLAATSAAFADPQKVDIATARSLPLASIVTVKGSVTVPSGVFSSSFFDEGFAIQDHTGGIYISTADNLGLTLREKASVTGQLVDSFGLLILVPAGASDVSSHGRGPDVEPLWVATGSVGEANQGRLVQVIGTISGPIEPDPPYGTKFELDDGSRPIRIFINTTTGIDLSGLAPGQRVSVTGMSSAFEDAEIDPRFPADIRQPEH